MAEQLSFIEKQFPVSKISKESYKERKSSQGQTITGMGKWWGRKPLILIRAAIIGCLLPTSDNPAKDMDVFLKIMSMDKKGLYLRKDKTISTKKLYEYVIKNRNLKGKYEGWFENSDGKVKLSVGAPKEDIEKAVFTTPFMNSIIPISTGKLSAWNTPNFYFYEIANQKSEIHIQLYFYCRNLSPEMREAFTHLADILGLGELEKGYNLYFETFKYQKKEEDTAEDISKQLDAMFAEVREFEKKIAEKWNI